MEIASVMTDATGKEALRSSFHVFEDQIRVKENQVWKLFSIEKDYLEVNQSGHVMKFVRRLE